MGFPTIEEEKAFYANLPKKRVGAGAVLLWNEKILLLKPSYKPGWTIPGGVVEAEESPLEACLREVYEETGLKVSKLRILTTDYFPTRDHQTEFLHFLFGAEIASDIEPNVVYPAGEIEDYKWLSPGELDQYLPQRLCTRAMYAIRAFKEGQFYYLEKGQPV